ncbi:histidine phosphatase family protein [Bdellovibrio sp. HCB288]|uniref:histidine phosphatase family protein n=1 Tax=Bdellovibrio sp. HCB288 TaxID=3394355 RepID=UPI0039B5EA58
MEFDPRVFRTVIFIRHGQYSSEPEKLTKLGSKQAHLTAKAVASLSPSKVHCSTMPRAMETASIIAAHAGLKFKASDMFREGFLPGTVGFNQLVSEKMSAKEKKAFFAKAKAARATADLAFDSLFKPPQRGQNTELVVAHGNVIRHWVCKALDIPSDRWLKMDVAHASLTTIRISKNGNICLLGFADTGHLPLKLRTYV